MTGCTSSGTLFDLRRYSIHDGPGIRTTVFFKGCPLRCAWCHNPESQSTQIELMLHPNRCIHCGSCLTVCLRQMDRAQCTSCGRCAEVCYAEARQMVGRTYTCAEVMAVLERDRAFYAQSQGGVTFSGGEPLSQLSFLLDLLQACREAGLHTALDTCGFAPWEVFERVLPYVDLYLYDLKLIDDARHRQYTGVSNALILANLQRLAGLGRPILLRMPVIPGVNDDEEALAAAARFVAGLPGRPTLHLLPYHSAAETKYAGLNLPYPLPETPSPSGEQMQAIRTRLEAAGLSIILGG